MFARLMMARMGMETAPTDTSFQSYFPGVNFRLEDGRKTPDLIFNGVNCFHVVEFAISDSDPMMTMMRKREKYDHICENIASQMSLNVYLSVVVLTPYKTVVVFGHQDIANWVGTDCPEILANLMRTVEDINNYRAMRNKFDTMINTNEIANKAEFHENLERLRLLKFRNRDTFHTFTLEMSLNAELMNRPEHFTKDKVEDPVIGARKMYEEVFPLNDMEVISSVYDNIKADIYTKEVSEMVALSPEKVCEKMDLKVRELIMVSVKKIPRAFKIPAVTTNMRPGFLPMSMVVKKVLSDGTYILKPEFEHYPKSEKSEVLGLPMKEITDFEMEMKRLFRVDTKRYPDLISMFKTTKFYEIMEMTEVWIRELILLTERRHVGTSKSNQMVYKDYNNFSIMVSNGPRLKDSNQVHFRILTQTSSSMYNNSHFIPFYPASHYSIDTVKDDLYLTNWISLEMADLEHYCTVCARARVILSDMWERTRESSASSKRVLDTMNFPEIFMACPILLLEHKRNTSTIGQLSRYLMHSGTSILSNYSKLADEIFEIPRRSIIQSWVVLKQANGS